MEKEIILGLDISTTTIGICLLLDDGSEHGQIIELTHVNPKVPKKTNKNETLFIKNKIFKEEFLSKYKDFGIKKVVIEAPLLQSNNVNTVGTLLQFNGMVSLSVYDTLGIVPNYISSYDARAYCFPELMSIRKYGKDGIQYSFKKIFKEVKDGRLVLFGGYPWTIDKKGVIQGKVAERFPSIEWLYDKRGELKKENFDACDAYVAVMGWLNKKRHNAFDFKVENVVAIKPSDTVQGKIDYDVGYWGRMEHRITYVDNIDKIETATFA